MKFKLMFLALFVAAAFFTLKTTSIAQDAKDGKTIFTEAKCLNCHAVASQGIEATNKKTKAPDLSNVGATYKADFIKKYLTKEEQINDKKHLIAFKGTPDELTTLATWLEGLKTAPKEEGK